MQADAMRVAPGCTKGQGDSCTDDRGAQKARAAECHAMYVSGKIGLPPYYLSYLTSVGSFASRSCVAPALRTHSGLRQFPEKNSIFFLRHVLRTWRSVATLSEKLMT